MVLSCRPLYRTSVPCLFTGSGESLGYYIMPEACAKADTSGGGGGGGGGVISNAL